MNNNKLKEICRLLNLEKFVFVDVGAAGGFKQQWKVLGDYLSVIGFEPDKERFNRLADNKTGENVKYYNSCVAEGASQVKFFVSGRSSCLKPNHKFLARFPMSERYHVQREAVVDADSLDNILVSDAADFIKIDTEGSEMPILKGSGNTLGNACGLEVEVQFSPLFEGQALFADVDTYLRNSGFSLFDLRPCYWKRSRCRSRGKGQIIFADALYFKDYQSLDTKPRQIGSIIIASIIYEKYSFALECVDYFCRKEVISREDRGKIMALILDLAKPAVRMSNFKGRSRIVSFLEKAVDLLESAHWARYRAWK